MRAWVSFFLLFLLAAPALGQSQQDFDRLVKTRRFDCSFTSGTTGYWKEGEITVKIDRNVPELTEASSVQILDVDIIEQTARVVTPWDSNEVLVWTTSKGLTFLLNDPMGNLEFITIFPYHCNIRDAFCAVHTQHVGRFGAATPSQSFGFCREKR